MLSILTATYNRVTTLPRLYESLRRQSSHDCEWIVIDDGSTDETESLVKSWIEAGSAFPIKYINQHNKGKHVALNVGAREASGAFCLIVDSDDWLPPGAVLQFLSWMDDVQARSDIAAVAGLKSFENGYGPSRSPTISGICLEAPNRDRTKHGLVGDLGAEAYRTDLLRNFPFPVFEDEKFLQEAIVWNRISDAGYTIRWHPVVVYNAIYQPGGLTDKSQVNQLTSFRGHTTYVVEAISGLNGVRRFRAIGAFAVVARAKGFSAKETGATLSTSTSMVHFALLAKRGYARFRTGVRPHVK